MRGLARADFADALGVVIREREVSVAHVSKRFNTIKVLDLATRPLEGPEGSRVSEAAAVLRAYAEERSIEDARVVAVVDRRATFFGTLTLPAGVVDNIADVVRYEIDRLFPVSADELYASHTVRPIGTAGERVAVRVVAALRPAVLEVVEVLREAGLAPSVITAEPNALADYYDACRGEGNDLAAAFTVADGRHYMTLVSDGVPVASHHVREGQDRLTLVAGELETSLPERSTTEPLRIVPEPAEEGEQTLASLAPAALLADAGPGTPDQLIAVGAAFGDLGESSAPTNLLPEEMVEARTGFGLREFALTGSVVLMAMGLAISIFVKDMAISSTLAGELARLEPEVEAVIEREEANQALLGKTLALESKSRSNVLAYLKEATTLIPQTAYLTTFRYREDRIEMDGIAGKASGLIAILEASPLFEGVDFTAPTTKYLQDQERFSLRMRLQRQ